MRRILIAAASLVLVCVAGASFALESQPADALTPTPSSTPTFVGYLTATNTSGQPADQLVVESIGFAAHRPVIVTQPVGCPVPTIATVFLGLQHVFPYQATPVVRTTYTWSTACVASAEGVELGLVFPELPNSVPDYPTYFFKNTTTATSTPAPPTVTPTPYTGAGLLFVNNNIPLADGVDLVDDVCWDCDHPFPTSVTVTLNPPGCGTPVVTVGSRDVVHHVYGPHGWVPIGWNAPVVSVRWPSPCVDLGEAVAVQLDNDCCFFSSYFSLGETPPPTVTPSPSPIGGVSMAIDCDVVTVGLQSYCPRFFFGASQTAVDVVVYNNGPAFQLGTFNFNVEYPDASSLVPPFVSCFDTYDCNPDFNQAGVTGGFDWACGPPNPNRDQDATAGVSSFISCFNGSASGPTIPSGGSLVLARIAYDIPFSAGPGITNLQLDNAAIFDSTFSPIHDGCANDPCIGAAIELLIEIEPPITPTPTGAPPNTTTPTITPTPTSTNTATPEGLAVNKILEGNANNADLSVPKANLWLCEAPAACAGPGEGALRVVERASNVLDGLGAYEFTVEYDNFVIASINPCDLVFGPGGAGALRGPVDELDTSLVNPDCSPDPGAGGGTCAYSLVLENLVHFGCVTSGQQPGPTGDFDLASLLLVPHPDLRNDIFPGNNNGVLTVLKDNGCELVDTLGHPVTGSINGGLTPYCRDLAVTVRILEGDLDLDCDVDLTDAQSIASRYGAFFGGLLYSKWYDLEPALHDLDIDIKDVQKVFGRQGSSCQTPVPAQPPLDPPFAFGD